MTPRARDGAWARFGSRALRLLPVGVLWLGCQSAPEEPAREPGSEPYPANPIDETRGWAEDDAER